MKTIITIIFIVGVQSLIFAQTNKKHPGKISNTIQCSLVYSENKWIINHSDSGKDHQCEDVAIKTMPPMSQTITPINLDIVYQGHYSFKKDPTLEIPEQYIVIIVHRLTGEHYNLNSDESYPFSLTRVSKKERFMMEIKYDGLKKSSTSKVFYRLFRGTSKNFICMK